MYILFFMYVINSYQINKYNEQQLKVVQSILFLVFDFYTFKKYVICIYMFVRTLASTDYKIVLRVTIVVSIKSSVYK